MYMYLVKGINTCMKYYLKYVVRDKAIARWN